MSRNWKRQLKLTVDDVTLNYTGEIIPGQPVQPDGLRIRFDISDASVQTPRIATIVITNLSDATGQKILTKVGKQLTLNVGYEDISGLAFSGEIKQVRLQRESPTDKICIINATTRDRAYNNAHVSKTLKAGSTGKDIYETCLKAMAPFGVTRGVVPDVLSQIHYPRPVTLFGLAREHLRDIALSAGCTWHIRNDSLDLIKLGEARQGSTIVLNSRSGLIGMPAQTNLGITAQILFNLAIGIDSKVQLDQASIQRAQLNFSAGGDPLNAEPNLPSVAADGLYRVIGMTSLGDTRGEPWYALLTLLRLGAGLNRAQVDAGFGLPAQATPEATPPAGAFIGKN